MSRIDADYYIKSYFRNGRVALHTWHTSKASFDIELMIYRERMRRGEIAKVVVTSNVAPFGTFTYLSAEDIPTCPLPTLS